jgi:hypothetical protein
MGATLYILAVGRERAILEVVERLINAHEGWKAAIATTEEEAIGIFKRQRFSIVFVCAGFSAGEEDDLRQRLLALDPQVIVTRHYGGGSGLLENEILSILER